MTISESGRILVQRAMQNPSSKKAPQISVKARKPALPQFLPVWFDVRVRGEQGDVQQLQAGESYTLAITGSLNRSSLHPEGITITDRIKLHLRCVLDVDAPLKIDPDGESFSLSYEEAAHLKEELTISIPAKFPFCHLILGLSYTLPGAYLEELGKCRVHLKGTYNPEDQKLLEASQIEVGLPEHVAILVVNPDSSSSLVPQNTFKLRGWSHWGEQLEKTARPRAIVSVAEMLDRQLDPVAIINSIRLFSGTISEDLTRWLLALYKKNPERLCIIIVDNTTLEIPWEMFEIDRGQYLGAIARVVRWMPFRRFSHRYIMKVADVPPHIGPVIAYLDGGMGAEETAPEREVLQKLMVDYYPSLQKLELRIRQSLEQIGLIYMGCHGQLGTILHAQTRQKRSDQLHSINLEMIYQSDEPRMTVFVNACESARVIQNNDLDPSNFVEGFLTHCAAGYIGTLTKVGVLAAADISRRILEAAMDTEGIQVAEILRRLRSGAVQQLKTALLLSDDEEEKRKQLYNVIDTFMYVYYGNPLARLRLLIADQNLLAANQLGEEIKALDGPDDGLNLRLPAANQKGEGA